jgi:hypothetical protein
MNLAAAATAALITMFGLQKSAAFVARQAFRPSTVARTISGTSLRLAEEGQAEVVLVGCGAPNRGE